MNTNIANKLTSRKFILAVITAITGIITLCVGENEVVKVISGAAMTIIPTVIYCIMEGVIDAKSIKTLTDTVVDTAGKLGANETTLDVIEQVGAVGEALVGEDAPEE